MITPYNDNATNLIYNLLFCDSIELYKGNTQPPYAYPFDVLFAETSKIDDLKKIVADLNVESRLKLLAYNKLLLSGYTSEEKELLAVLLKLAWMKGWMFWLRLKMALPATSIRLGRCSFGKRLMQHQRN